MSDGTQSVQAAKGGTLRELAEVAALMGAVAAILSFLVHEVYSLDIWWQVTIGRSILEERAVPSVDRFSILGFGRPYHDSHWLFQVALALCHSMMGMAGVQVVTICVWGLALAFCYGGCRRWAGPLLTPCLLFVAAMASAERFLPRPEIVTFLGVTAFYALLQSKTFPSKRDCMVLAFLQVIWANCHGLFVIGPFMVGCYWLTEAVTHFRGGGDTKLRQLSVALGLVLAATLVTPFGFAGWKYAILLFSEAFTSEPGVMKSVGELSPTFGQATRSGPAFWFYLVMLVLVAISGIRALMRKKVSPRMLILAGLCAASLSGRRNIVIFALAAAPFLAEHLPGLPQRLRNFPALAGIGAGALMAAYSFFPLSGAYYLKMEYPGRSGFGATPSFFPHALPAFLDRIGFEGKVLNSNMLGGFYAYHGYPSRLPFTDGRWEVYETETLNQAMDDSRNAAKWRDLVKEHEITGILLGHTSPEAQAIVPGIRHAQDWRLVYCDSAASFWLSEALPSLPPEINVLDLAALPPLKRLDDGIILDKFLALAHAPEPRAANLRRMLAFDPEREATLAALGPLLNESGHYDAARETLDKLLETNPRSIEALDGLAFLAYREGDLDTALAFIRSALAVEPGNEELQANYSLLLEAAQGPHRTRESASEGRDKARAELEEEPGEEH